MSVTEDAQRVVIDHQPARPDGAYGSFMVCSCNTWRGHRDQYPAHVVDALNQDRLLRPEVIDLENLGLSRIEITSAKGKPTHVLIERNGAPIVNGYMEGPRAGIAHPRIDAPVPAGEPRPARGVFQPTARVEQRMLALAADMERDSPFTAGILRQFATEVTYLRALLDPDGVDDITAMWPDLVHQYADRERLTRELVAKYALTTLDDDAVRVITELREILGPDTTTPTERTCPGGC
jgi:hypothetical protein